MESTKVESVNNQSPLLSTISGKTLIGLFLIIILFYLLIAPGTILAWDIMGYHVYFVQGAVLGNWHIKDLSFYENIAATYQNTETLYQFVQTPNGEHITKYSSGWAVMNAPFLMIGHWFAGWFGYAQDGFSAPYQTAAAISSLFYTFIGLIFSRKVLLRFFSDKATALLLILLVLGTNFLHMNSGSPGMSHIFVYSLYAILIDLTIRFHKSPNTRKAILIGLTLGLMILVRPLEVVAAAIPLLYGVVNLKTLWKRISDGFLTPYYYVAIFFMIAVYAIQMLFWKETTGEYLFYSYINAGEGLDFNRPHIWEVLFSYRKGWFIYTPIALLSIIGFYGLYKKGKVLFWGVLLFFIANLYLVSCWTTWWYASSFSQRALIQSYPVVILLIGFAIHSFQGASKKIVLGFSGLCLILNLFQTWQAGTGVLHLSNMSKSYYWSIFGQLSEPTPEQRALLLIDRGKTNFDNMEDYVLKQVIHGKRPYPVVLTTEHPFSEAIDIPYNKLTDQEHLWIRCKAVLQAEEELSVNLLMCAAMQYQGDNYFWRAGALPTISTEKTDFYFDYLTPDLRTNEDVLSTTVWLQNGTNVTLHDFQLEIWEPKKER